MSRRLFLAALGLWAAQARTAAAAPLPPYQPRAVSPPENRPYQTADGSIRIVGYADVAPLLAALNRHFAETHPGFRFAFEPALTRQAAAALAGGRSAFAPMGAEFEAGESADYRRLAGSEPLAFGIAHDPINSQAKSGPVGIFVHPSNPLTVLTTAQVQRIFARVRTGESLTRWGQLGLGGEWRELPIVPCGIPFGVGVGVFMQHEFGGKPSASAFLPFRQSEAILAYVGSHPGAVGFARINPATARVKLVGIDRQDGRGPSRASADDLIAGRYAYDRPLLIYVRQPLEPWIAEYLRLIYSRDGQALVAGSPPHYLPLTPEQAAAERDRLPP